MPCECYSATSCVVCKLLAGRDYEALKPAAVAVTGRDKVTQTLARRYWFLRYREPMTCCSSFRGGYSLRAHTYVEQYSSARSTSASHLKSTLPNSLHLPVRRVSCRTVLSGGHRSLLTPRVPMLIWVSRRSSNHVAPPRSPTANCAPSTDWCSTRARCRPSRWTGWRNLATCKWPCCLLPWCGSAYLFPGRCLNAAYRQCPSAVAAIYFSLPLPRTAENRIVVLRG